jgi:O-antigen ligase
MVSSGIVFFEPAPIDLALVLFIPFAFLVGRPAVHARLSVPLTGLFLFLVTNLVSVVVADDPGATLRFLAITLYLIALCFTLALLLTRHGRVLGERTLAAYSVGIAGAAWISLAGFVGLLPIQSLVAPMGRLQGFFKDPNVFGAALVPALVFSLAMLGAREGRRAWWISVAGVCAVGAVLSYSRGCWVNVVITLIAFYGLRLLGNAGRRRGLRTLVGFCLAMAFLAPIIWRLVELPAVQEMLQIRLRYQNYDTNRFATQVDAILAAIEHPLGIGPGVSESTFSRATHSLYVRALIENGPLGLLSMLLLLLSSLGRVTWRALGAEDDRSRAFLSAVAAMLWGLTAESFVIDSVHWRHFWIVLALAWTPTTLALRPLAARARPPRGP